MSWHRIDARSHIVRNKCFREIIACEEELGVSEIYIISIRFSAPPRGTENLHSVPVVE